MSTWMFTSLLTPHTVRKELSREGADDVLLAALQRQQRREQAAQWDASRDAKRRERDAANQEKARLKRDRAAERERQKQEQKVCTDLTTAINACLLRAAETRERHTSIVPIKQAQAFRFHHYVWAQAPAPSRAVELGFFEAVLKALPRPRPELDSKALSQLNTTTKQIIMGMILFLQSEIKDAEDALSEVLKELATEIKGEDEDSHYFDALHSFLSTTTKEDGEDWYLGRSKDELLSTIESSAPFDYEKIEASEHQNAASPSLT